MSDITLVKVAAGALVPADDESREALQSWRLGQGVRVKVTRARNVQFHKKWFALLGVAFDAWSERMPPVHVVAGRAVKPSRERFRKDITVLAGHFDPVWNIDGDMRLEPRSIAFANMEQDEFDRLYSRTIDVILSKILPDTGWTEERLREAAEAVMEFA